MAGEKDKDKQIESAQIIRTFDEANTYIFFSLSKNIIVSRTLREFGIFLMACLIFNLLTQIFVSK